MDNRFAWFWAACFTCGFAAVVGCASGGHEEGTGVDARSSDAAAHGAEMDASAPKDAAEIADSGLKPDAGDDVDDAAEMDATATTDSGAITDSGVVTDSGIIPDAGSHDGGRSSFDPLPAENTPGARGGTGCPSSVTGTGTTAFHLSVGNVTSQTFTGTITAATGDGQFFVKGPNGQQLFGTVPTNVSAGSYSVRLPLFCGAQVVKFLWPKLAGQCVLVLGVDTSGCGQPDIRATLGWDANGRDWELHLIKPGGRINDNATDCTWSSCIGSSPDWGMIGDQSDNPTKDVDSTGPYGPENILHFRPETGTFNVMVEHWGNGDAMSDGQVILNLSTGALVVIDIIDLAPLFVRTVATIDWPSGIVHTSTVVHDCRGNWSGGCRDPIPN